MYINLKTYFIVTNYIFKIFIYVDVSVVGGACSMNE